MRPCGDVVFMGLVNIWRRAFIMYWGGKAARAAASPPKLLHAKKKKFHQLHRLR